MATVETRQERIDRNNAYATKQCGNCDCKYDDDKCPCCELVSVCCGYPVDETERCTKCYEHNGVEEEPA